MTVSKTQVIEVDVEYVEQVLKQRGIKAVDFSTSLGYSSGWWSCVKSNSGRVRPNVARLMCNMYMLDYDKLTAQEAPPLGQSGTKPAAADDETLRMLARIEHKMDRLLALWG